MTRTTRTTRRSTTIVAAVAEPGPTDVRISVAWMGDSRAYWVEPDAATVLTEDHEIGGRLLRWIGADGDGQPAEVVQHQGRLDGLLGNAPKCIRLPTSDEAVCLLVCSFAIL